MVTEQDTKTQTQRRGGGKVEGNGQLSRSWEGTTKHADEETAVVCECEVVEEKAGGSSWSQITSLCRLYPFPSLSCSLCHSQKLNNQESFSHSVLHSDFLPFSTASFP